MPTVTDIANNFEDEVFDEMNKKKYDKCKTAEELSTELNNPKMFDKLVDCLADYYGMEFEEAEDYIVDHNLLYNVLKTNDITKLLENRVKTMRAHRTTPNTKKPSVSLKKTIGRIPNFSKNFRRIC